MCIVGYDYDGAAGSSYNLIFEDDKGEVISRMSFGWPEDKVLIEETYYSFIPEQQYLLYSYIADACFIDMTERHEVYKSIKSDMTEVMNEKVVLSKEVEALEEKLLLFKNEIMVSDLDFYWKFVWNKAFESEGEISKDAIDAINVLLQPTIRVEGEEKTSQVNPLQGFFISSYDDVSNIDLSVFLMYCPLRDEQYDRSYLDEFEELRQHKNWCFTEAQTYDNMPVPIHRYRADAIDGLFMKYAGVSLDELSGVNSESLIYLESTDAYYNFTSDFGPGHFECNSGSLDGDVLTLYSGSKETGAVLMIAREGEHYYIRRFVRG